MYKFSLLLISILLFTGCQKTLNFDQHNRGITFSDGEAIRVPYGSYYDSKVTDTKYLAHLEKEHFSGCKVGDQIWIEGKLLKKATKDKDNLIHKNYSKWLANAQKKGLAGCASPLSDREYEYYTGRERQTKQHKHEQNIQQQKNTNESLERLNDSYNATKPVKVEVD